VVLRFANTSKTDFDSLLSQIHPCYAGEKAAVTIISVMMAEPVMESLIAIKMVAGALNRALNPQTERDSNLVPRLRTRTRSGQWLALYGSLTEPSFERPSETVIEIGPAKPEEVAWLNVAAYGLSPREEKVLRLVVRGLSNRQISQSPFISENAIQSHLSNIFEKVGVRSRKALLKQLFFDRLLPSLLGD
jgi:DNA-binding CsgD family transcriptional regulator